MKQYFDGKLLGYINVIMLITCFICVIPRIQSRIDWMSLYIAAVVVLLQTMCYILLRQWNRRCDEKLEAGVDRDEQRIPIMTASLGALLYSIMYSMYSFIFFDIPQMKIFMLVPVVIAIFYRRRGFAHMQTGVQLLFLILSIAIKLENMPYYVDNVPVIVNIVIYAFASLQLMTPLIKYDTIKQEALEQKRMIEAKEHAQVVFAGNIGGEFNGRLDDIIMHCENIKTNNDNERVKHNANDIIGLCDEIREVVSATALKTGVTSNEN